MAKLVWIALVISLCALVDHSHGTCVRKSDDLIDEGMIRSAFDDANPFQKEENKVAGFFKKVGCKIVRGGETVKDGVVSGFRYIKDKLTPLAPEREAADMVRSANLKLNSADDDDEIDDSRPVWDVETTTTNSTELDNRFILDAPKFCPKNQVLDSKGRCRAVVG